jgi:hypothetical protein
LLAHLAGISEFTEWWQKKELTEKEPVAVISRPSNPAHSTAEHTIIPAKS